MDTYGVLSILTPVFAIFLAIRTKQVYLSLSAGLYLGYLVLANWNPFLAAEKMVHGVVDVFSSSGNTQTVIFCILMGALIEFTKKSGGISGFVSAIDKLVNKKKSGQNQRKLVQVFAAIMGIVIFVETNVSSLTVGTIFRPIFTKLGVSEKKLAYIVDSSSAPVSALLPFNAWGAFIMGLLISEGIQDPFKTLVGVFSFNLYPIITLLLLFAVIIFSFSFGSMRKYDKESNVKDLAVMSIDDDQNTEKVKKRLVNFVLPLAVMLISMPFYLVITGQENGGAGNKTIWEIMQNANGSLSVLYAVTTSLLSASIMYKIQKSIGFKKQVDVAFEGMKDLFPLGMLMVLAFMISNLCSELGTGLYVAQLAKEGLPAFLMPAIIFLLSSFISFSTGTSWGTFAIMISIAIPLSVSFDMSPSLLTAAVVGGGVFGDHCSPISDTTIISSMASGCDPILHVRTQMPYALIAGFLSLIGFLILGIIHA